MTGDDDNWLLLNSGFAAACPRLTELTIIFPYCLRYDRRTEWEFTPDLAEVMSELVGACEALPDFNVLQIVRFSISPYWTMDWRSVRTSAMEQLEQKMRKRTKEVEDLALDCLKMHKARCREGGGRKRTTLKVITFPRDPLSGEVEEVLVCTEVG